jgi:mono/diheme cytochrome c family protein
MRHAAWGALVALVAAAAGCDESVVWHAPDPDLNRMLEQPRIDPYDPSGVFDDGLGMRRPPDGTIPHELSAVESPPVTRDLLALGRARFETFCAACHGVLGDGRSVVAEKMALRKPPSLHEPRLVARAAPEFVTTIEQGFGLMPSYADALAPRDRWAVAHYVKALQFARAARVDELPPDARAALAKEAP